MDDALKPRGIKYLNVENWLLLFAPPIKISGNVPGLCIAITVNYGECGASSHLPLPRLAAIFLCALNATKHKP